MISNCAHTFSNCTKARATIEERRRAEGEGAGDEGGEAEGSGSGLGLQREPLGMLG